MSVDNCNNDNKISKAIYKTFTETATKALAEDDRGQSERIAAMWTFLDHFQHNLPVDHPLTKMMDGVLQTAKTSTFYDEREGALETGIEMVRSSMEHLYL